MGNNWLALAFPVETHPQLNTHMSHSARCVCVSNLVRYPCPIDPRIDFLPNNRSTQNNLVLLDSVKTAPKRISTLAFAPTELLVHSWCNLTCKISSTKFPVKVPTNHIFPSHDHSPRHPVKKHTNRLRIPPTFLILPKRK